MTPQDHIDLIAKLTWTLESKARETKRAAKATEQAAAELHAALDAAQAAYQAEHGGITTLSGGTNKPPVDDPDEPVEP